MIIKTIKLKNYDFIEAEVIFPLYIRFRLRLMLSILRLACWVGGVQLNVTRGQDDQ